MSMEHNTPDTDLPNEGDEHKEVLSNDELREQRMPKYRRIIKRTWLLIVAGIVGFFAFFVFLSFGDLPDTKELENPKSVLATEVIGIDGSVLGRFFIENRVKISYDSLSENVKQALVATEDARFFEHSGIDFRALARVFVKTILGGDKSGGGGSTITQQLSKLLFTDNASRHVVERAMQKFREWIISVQLERKYTKGEIMAMYLNKFDFLNDGDGIQAASEVYFGKPQSELTIEEAAMLVGMLKNPSLFNPVSQLKWKRDTTIHRREVVLFQMKNKGFISQVQYDSLRQVPYDGTTFKTKTHNDGPAQYFRGELSKKVQSILNKEQHRKPDGTKYNIYRDGLKIYTTIDPVIQNHMETALVDHMSNQQNKFNKHWKWRGKSPWDYKTKDTSDAEMRARRAKKARMIRESDRYQRMRITMMAEVTAAIEKENDGALLRPVDITRMLKEEKTGKEFAALLKKEYISKKMVKNYLATMKSDTWAAYKKQNEKFILESKKVFDTPVKMKVFTYENRDFIKDTIMSPLDSLLYHHNFLQLGSLAVDPKSGYVKGWIGGINYRYFKYDHVTSDRQVGSTFKPFIYATAIDNLSISPCLEVYDRAQTIFPEEGQFGLLEPWTPANSDGKYSGELISLKDGLKKSLNTVSVNLMKKLGNVDLVVNLVNQLGIQSDKIPRSPSICLGASDLSVMDMSGAYTAFANKGQYTKPIFLLKIEDMNGKVIYSDQSIPQQAIAENKNYVMVEMLRYAAEGTVQYQHKLKTQLGGKTGTTNDYTDGWFMGITPNLVIGTWVGGDDRWIRFTTIGDGQGSRMARPYFGKVLELIEKDSLPGFGVDAKFEVPQGDIGIELDCEEYQRTNQGIDINDPDEFNEEEEKEEEDDWG
jgi:penicillin-binding protein 1A